MLQQPQRKSKGQLKEANETGSVFYAAGLPHRLFLINYRADDRRCK